MDQEHQLKQLADRQAIRELVDQYAFCADSRDVQGQMALFTEDTHFAVYMDSRAEQPAQVINSRGELFPVFDNLNTYHATMHFNGQNSVTIDGDQATGLAYCMAHHLTLEDGNQKWMIAAIRYLDNYHKTEGKWLFSKRKLMVDWIENR